MNFTSIMRSIIKFFPSAQFTPSKSVSIATDAQTNAHAIATHLLIKLKLITEKLI